MTVPYTGDIEIRVHGVSGTPPQELLCRDAVQQVAGDRVAGFFRPAQPDRQRDSAGPDAGPWLEGYSWGGMTSGARTRALWLMLAPFALINVAPRMLPPEPEGRPGLTRLRLLAAALLRVLAVLLTCTLVLGVTLVSLTTVARRCATVDVADRVCSGLPRVFTDLLGRLSAAQQLGVCTLIPIVAVGLLWLISRRSDQRYDVGPVPRSGSPAAGAVVRVRPDDDEMPLARTDLFDSAGTAGRLRVAHVQAGLLTALGTFAWLFPPSAPRTGALAVALALAALVLATVVLRPPVPRVLAATPALGWTLVAALVVLAAVLVVDDPPATALEPDRLVSVGDALVTGLFIGGGLLLAALLALVAAGRVGGAGRGREMFVGGYCAVLAAFLAYLFGSMLTASVLVLGPSWLGTPGFVLTPGRVAAMLADHPSWFGDTSRSSGIGMLVGAGVLALLGVGSGIVVAIGRVRGGFAVDRAAVAAEYPRSRDPGAQDGARRSAIGFVFFIGRVVNYLPALLAAFAVAVTVFLGVQLAAFASASGTGPPSRWAAMLLGRMIPDCSPGAAGPCPGSGAVAWGAYGVASLLAGLVVLGVACYRTRGVRRGVGVLWDLTCFWPREAHPFAPPCYNERIMPEVRTRIAWYLAGGEGGEGCEGGEGDEVGEGGEGGQFGEECGPAPDGPGGSVVLAGHSQGSVIAFTAVLGMAVPAGSAGAPDAGSAAHRPGLSRPGLALLTCGCVLDRLYARSFPRYFGPDVFARAAAHLTDPATGRVMWVNLWRRSDYLGGAVPYPDPALGPLANVELLDPPFARAPGSVLYPVPARHSDFWSDPAYVPQVTSLFDQIHDRRDLSQRAYAAAGPGR